MSTNNTSRTNKKAVLAAAALVLAAVLMAAVYHFTRPAAAAGSKTFQVEVTHSSGDVAAFDYRTDAGYLGEVLLDAGLVQGEEGPYGLYLTAVDGERAVYETDNAYWALLVNGEYAVQGIDQTPIEDGAVYGLVHTPAA